MVSLWSFLAFLLCLAIRSAGKSSTGNSVLVVLEPTFKRELLDILQWAARTRLRPHVPSTKRRATCSDSRRPCGVLACHTVRNRIQELLAGYHTAVASNSALQKYQSPRRCVVKTDASDVARVRILPHPPSPGTPLVSHFPQRDTPATVIPVSVPASHAVLTPNLPPVWFSGVPFAFGSNPHIVPILNAPTEGFAADSDRDSGADAIVDAADKGGEGLWAGSSLGLVAGFQTVGGARTTWAGSVDLFSDEFATKEIAKGLKSGNAQFAADVAAWTFQESLVLKIDGVTHHRVNETKPRETYTINDHVVFSIQVSKYNPATSTWEPYSAIKDMQLEFTMLDPHIRTVLKPVAGEPGKYSVTFRVPDRHGVFKFVVDYKRKGWSYLESTTVVPVVPPRHDEYPRFLSPAWPYYAGAISTSLGFVLFCALWLAGDNSEPKKTKGAKSD